MFPKWLLLLSVAVNGVRVAEKRASADTKDAGASALATSGNFGKVEGKVIKCTVRDTVVFEQAEEDSTFTASLEYVEDENVGSTDWVVTIPGIFQIKVDSGSMMVAQLGNWFVPEGYNIYPTEEVDPAGKEMQESLTDTDNWVQKVRIIRGSTATSIKVIAERRHAKKGNVEIEFTGGPGPVEARVDLPDLGYYLPMQGDILRLILDGRTLFDKANSESKFPVVCTPSLFNIPGPDTGPARGLSVDFVGFTNFWVWKSEMERSGNFTPISHGYSDPNNEDSTYLAMWTGFRRWNDATTKLTIRNNHYTAEIFGGGLEVVFSRENVEGKLTKCTNTDGSVVFDKAAEDSAISTSLSYVDNPAYIGGWAIIIPSVVRIILKKPASENLEEGFRTKFQTCDTLNSTAPIDPSGQALRGVFCSGAIENVIFSYDSHKTITIAAHMWNTGKIVQIGFTRGPGTAMADNYVTA